MFRTRSFSRSVSVYVSNWFWLGIFLKFDLAHCMASAGTVSSVPAGLLDTRQHSMDEYKADDQIPCVVLARISGVGGCVAGEWIHGWMGGWIDDKKCVCVRLDGRVILGAGSFNL